MSEPLLSRFNIMNVQPPSVQQMTNVINSAYQKILKTNPCGSRFKDNLHENVINKLSTLNPREIQRKLSLSFGKVAKLGRDAIEPREFALGKCKLKRGLGLYDGSGMQENL